MSARYFFDLHDDSLSSWDNEGLDRAGPDQIVAHAQALLTDAMKASRDDHAVVPVRGEVGSLIVTVTLKRLKGLQVSWSVRLKDP